MSFTSLASLDSPNGFASLLALITAGDVNGALLVITSGATQFP